MNNEYIALSGSRTQTGTDIEFNTDAIIDFPIAGGHVYAVSDGRGGANGHAALAAKLTVESIKKYFSNKVYKNISNALTNAVSFANFSVFEQAAKDPKYAGIGATIAVLIYHDEKCYYAYAGDSRIYILSNGVLKALTKDHRAENEDAKTDEPQVLIGRDKDIKFGVCINPIKVEPEHKFLVCTDGLTDQLSSEEIAEVLNEEDVSVEHQAMNLIEKATEKQLDDCVSLHIIEFGTDTIADTSKSESPINFKSWMIPLIAIVAASILGFGAYKGFVYLSQTDHAKVDEVEEAMLVEPSAEEQLIEEETIEEELVIEKVSKVVVEPVVVKKKPNQETAVNNGTIMHKHKVAYGENIYRLGLRYGIGQDELVRINGNNATNLVAGSYLKIPVKAICVVKAGESWSVISDRYNVKIVSIAKASKIEPNVSLNEGQKLVIPLK